MTTPFSIVHRLLAPAACCIAALSAQSTSPQILSPLAALVPAVAEHSAWTRDWDGGETPARPTPSVADPIDGFEVGNGLAFASVGEATQACALRNVVGPQYADPRRTHLQWALTVNGDPASTPRRSLRRVRRAACVVTQDRGPEVAMRTLAFAPPRVSSIVQVIAIDNLSASPVKVTLACQSATRNDAAAIGVWIDGVQATERTLQTHDIIPPHATVHHVLLLDTAQPVAKDEGHARPTTLHDAVESLRRCVSSRPFGPEATVYDSDDAQLRSVFEDARQRLQTFCSKQTGLLHAMDRDAKATVSHNTGAVLAMLRLGMLDAAASLLRAQSNALWQQAVVQDQLLLPPPTPSTGGPAASLHIASTRAAAQIVLAHGWVARAMGTDAVLRDADRRLIAACVAHCRAACGESFRGTNHVDTAHWAARANLAADGMLPAERRQPNLAYTLAAQLEKRFGLLPGRAHRGLPPPGAQGQTLGAFEDLIALSEEDPSGRKVTEWNALFAQVLQQASGLRCPGGSLDSTLALDALATALTGIRQRTLPGWDHRSLRIAPRLPLRTQRFAVAGHQKDRRRLDLQIERRPEPLAASGSAIRFKLQLSEGSPPPPAGFWDVAARCGGTLFVRHLAPATPSTDPAAHCIDESAHEPAHTR